MIIMRNLLTYWEDEYATTGNRIFLLRFSYGIFFVLSWDIEILFTQSQLGIGKSYFLPFHDSNQIYRKGSKSTKEKVSGPDSLNHDSIRYSDIQIR